MEKKLTAITLQNAESANPTWTPTSHRQTVISAYSRENILDYIRAFFKAHDNVFHTVAQALKNLWLSVILWYILGYFVPTLRDDLPHLYQVVDLVMKGVDKLFEFVLNPPFIS